MSILFTLGWVLLGGAMIGFLVTFWDDIRHWLNNVAADAVERIFGYKARHTMQRAIAKVDRVMDVVRNRATIYVKDDPLSEYISKVDVIGEAPAHEIDEKVLNEIQERKTLVQEFEYKG